MRITTRNQNILFAKGDLQHELANRLQNSNIEASVNQIAKDQILAISQTDILEHLLHDHIVEPLTLFGDRMVADELEAEVDVSLDEHRPFIRDRSSPIYTKGGAIKCTIPYTGDAFLWNLNPGLGPGRYTLSGIFPHGQVRSSIKQQGHVEFTIAFAHDDMKEDRIQGEVDQNLRLLKTYVGRSKESVDKYNLDLRTTISRKIEDRRKMILKIRNLADRLDIPLKRHPEAPSMRPNAMKRKLARPLAPASRNEFRPEPGIGDGDYEHILSVVRHELATFETTATTYRSLDETDLRNILLAHLNGHYEGDATGETFRNVGKTDIRIEFDDRAAFVAECKIWQGPSGFSAAIDQLLGYLTWRDCKAAIVVFNKKNMGFTDIQDKIGQQLPLHSLSKRAADGQQRAGEWRFVFRSPEDERKEVSVHVFAANLFVPNDPDGARPGT